MNRLCLSILFIGLLTTAAHASSVIAHYSFDEVDAADPSKVIDTSGNHKHGSIIGSVIRNNTDAKSGQSVQFQSYTDRITLPDLYSNLGTGGFAISMWVKELNQMPGNSMPVLFRQVDATDNNISLSIQRDRRASLGHDHTTSAVRDHTGTTNNWITVSNTNHTLGGVTNGTLGWTNDDIWHHIVFGRDATHLYFVIDGVIRSSVAAPVDIQFGSDNRTTLGATWYQNQWVQAWDGLMDEVTFYDGWIGSDGVASLYQSPGTILNQTNSIPAPLAVVGGLLTFAWLSRKRKFVMRRMA